MSQDQTKKEALFNEVKGSLFEYLMGREIALLSNEELKFLDSIDRNYLHVLSQQDRMVRQFYPEMLPFLKNSTRTSVTALTEYLKETPTNPRLMGKFSNSSIGHNTYEADLLIETSKGVLPLSLKLNKKNAFVNTKSGGIKSFFTSYFSNANQKIQLSFNQMVDYEFNRMSHELHAMNDLEYNGDFNNWIKAGKSELPGELNREERNVLKAFYARIAKEMHSILSELYRLGPEAFRADLPALLGFSDQQIIQLICFHDFKSSTAGEVKIHSYEEVIKHLATLVINDFAEISSVEMISSNWSLQIRVKPMNKFTTTAIKINCSVKFKQCEEF
jgi:hypothetical protein